VLLALSTVVAIGQNLIGVPLAKLLGESPLLGLVCGSLTLMGGVGTAAGFAGELEKAGLVGASVIGVAAATLGLVAGGLLGGPLGGWLINSKNLKSEARPNVHLESGQTAESGFFSDVRALLGYGWVFLAYLVVLVICLKAGAWVSYLIQKTGITFPVYMGAMILGLVIRNLADLFEPRLIRTEIVDTIGSITLAIFLTVVMLSLNLLELASVAGPMLVILTVQVAFMALFTVFVAFPLLGRSFDAAIATAGLVGFGLGATPNAVANMKTLVDRFGPSPRAFLVVPVVGGFLIDLINSINITVFLNVLK
jgi:glutamate:Na+ symporter, ESS family